MASTARVQILNGPIGSGKTTTALMKGIGLARRQRASTQDREAYGGQMLPVRKFRLCVVRDTYRQLWKTTLPSWFKRVPRDVGEFVGSENAPARHDVTFIPGDGTAVRLSVDFIAIGENAAEDVLRGYEPTAFYLNEADLLSREVFTYAFGRTGRYPDMSEGGPTWHGVLMDANAPEETSWLFEDMFRPSADELRAAGVELFRQPSGLSPQAENLDNLPAGYYTAQAAIQPAWYVARMIENKPGYSRAGKPVYPEFNDALHVPGSALAPVPGLPLILGLDAGLNPACAATQRLPNGRRLVLGELVAETGTGPLRFSDSLNQWLNERFPNVRTIIAYADPSAAYGADVRGGEQSWIEIVGERTKLRVRAAPTNKLIPRLEAVRRPLTRLIDGQPGFQLSPTCKVLREGFNSGYRYRKRQGTETDFDDVPDKNKFSHPHDALQYAMSGDGEDAEIRERGAARWQELQRVQHVHDWDPVEQGGGGWPGQRAWSATPSSPARCWRHAARGPRGRCWRGSTGSLASICGASPRLTRRGLT